MWLPRPRPSCIALLLLCLTGCRAAPPPCEASVALGCVRAETPTEAWRVAAQLTELGPRVRDALPGTREGPVEIWVQRKLRLFRGRSESDHTFGFTVVGTKRIHLRGKSELQRHFLVHELVHSLLGEEWRPLPGVLEEGLADLVATQLVPEAAPRVRTARLLRTAGWLGGGLPAAVVLRAPGGPAGSLRTVRWNLSISAPGGRDAGLSVQDALRISTVALASSGISEETEQILRGLGFLLCDRIVDRGGYPALRDLCLRASREGHSRVPAGWVFQAAGLGPDRADLLEAVRAAWVGIDPAEVAAQISDDLVAVLGGQLRARPDAESPREWLATRDPRLDLGGESLRLAEVEPVVRAIERAWDASAR